MQINMLEAKSQLSRLVQAALDGEEVILARNGEPVARITRYVPVEGKRNPGAFKDAIRMTGDWDSPATNRRLGAAIAAGARDEAVLDTYFVLWWLGGNPKLGTSSRRSNCCVRSSSRRGSAFWR